MSLLSARYFFSASLALSDRKTTRNLLPLPRTANSPLSILTLSRVSEHSSDTRKPVEKRVSKIARSRKAETPSPLGAARPSRKASADAKALADKPAGAARQ